MCTFILWMNCSRRQPAKPDIKIYKLSPSTFYLFGPQFSCPWCLLPKISDGIPISLCFCHVYFASRDLLQLEQFKRREVFLTFFALWINWSCVHTKCWPIYSRLRYISVHCVAIASTLHYIQKNAIIIFFLYQLFSFFTDFLRGPKILSILLSLTTG